MTWLILCCQTCLNGCSPYGETVAQTVVEVLRHLYERSRAWGEAIERAVLDRMTTAGAVLDRMATAGPDGQRRAVLADAFAKGHPHLSITTAQDLDLVAAKTLPALALLADIDGGLKVGSRVKCGGGDDDDEGVVVRVPDLPDAFVLPTVEVYWTRGQFQSRTSQVPASKLEVAQTRDFDFNFNCLTGERSSAAVFDVLYKLCHALRLRKAEFSALLHRVEDDCAAAGGGGGGLRQLSPSPQTRLAAKRASEASPLNRVRLKDTREAQSSSSMELLSDLLVSSIIDEVTGKAAAVAAAASEPPPDDNERGGGGNVRVLLFPDDVPVPDAPDDRSDLIGALLETAMLQLSSMHYLAGKAMLAMASSRYLEPALQPSIAKFMQECVKTLTTEGIPNPPLKRRVSEAEVERAFSVVRSNPEQRRKLERGEEVDEEETGVGKEEEVVTRGRWRAVDIDTRKVRRRAGRKTGAPQTPGMAAAAAASPGGSGARTQHVFPHYHQLTSQHQQQQQQHPIHIPLSAMGFSDNHISLAIRTLRIRQDDLSAGTINSVAMWMIDHPESPPGLHEAAAAASSPPPGPRSSSSARPAAVRRQHTHPRSGTLAQDIRSYFRQQQRTSIDQGSILHHSYEL